MPDDVLERAAYEAAIELLRRYCDTEGLPDLNDIRKAPLEQLEKAANVIVPLAKTNP